MSEAISGWPRIVGEVVAIVVSILLAFAIDAWWDERALRIEEQQVLEGLNEEFLYVQELLTEHLDVHLEDLAVLKSFLLAADSGNIDDAGPIVDAVVLVLLSPMTTDLGSGTLDALLSSGRIEILRSRTLRAKLASWEGVIGEVWDDQALQASSVFASHIPYLLAEGVPAGSSMHQWYDEWPLTRRSPSDDPEMVAQLLGDETLREMVALSYGFKRHTTEEFNIALAAVDEILQEIGASMD